MNTSSEKASWHIWVAVIVLSIGSFAIVTTELAPIGLLSPIASAFEQSEAHTGLIVTVYAWVAAAAALLSALFLYRVPRKPLLVGLMLILALSSMIAAMTLSFSALLGARVIGALAHGAFWAMIGSLGSQIAPKRYVGLATSIIFGGVSAASVLGVPLANVIGHLDSWRSAFGAITILSLATSIAIAFLIPNVPVSAPIGRRALTAILRDRTILRIYGITTFVITAHFAAFTYIEPLLLNTMHVPTGFIGVLLLAFGIAGLFGNLLTGVLIDRYLKPLVLASLVLMGICLSVIGALGAGVGIAIIALLLMGWGIGVAAIFVGFQTWILRQAGDAAMPASAIYVAIFNAAIGTGALVGSAVLSLTNPSGLMTAAAVTVIGSLVPVFLLATPTAATSAPPPVTVAQT